MSEAISHAMFVLDLQGVVPPPTGIKDLVAWTNTIGGTPRAVVLFEALCSPLTLPESDSETEALQATSRRAAQAAIAGLSGNSLSGDALKWERITGNGRRKRPLRWAMRDAVAALQRGPRGRADNNL